MKCKEIKLKNTPDNGYPFVVRLVILNQRVFNGSGWSGAACAALRYVPVPESPGLRIIRINIHNRRTLVGGALSHCSLFLSGTGTGTG
jgi:hypothetical protein